MNKLEQLIVDELKAINIDRRYDDMLDEIYPTVAGMSFSTSRAIKELDATAYHCGLADYVSEENFVEINGKYYDLEECEKIRNNLVSDFNLRLAELRQESKGWENYSF